MKKTLTLLMAACMFLTFFVGCQSQAPATVDEPTPVPTAAPTPEPATPEPATPEPEEVVTIEFYTWEESLKDNNAAVIAAFEAKYPNIKVNINYPVENDNAAYTEKMDLLLTSNTQIDCMMESAVSRMANKADRGVYQSLDSLIAAEGITYEDIYTVSSIVDGSYYGFPIDVTPWFVMMNKKMLDEAGLPIPSLDWTWDDYREYAKKLTADSSAEKGSYFHTWNNYYLMGMYSAKMDNAMFKADGSLAFDEPAFKDWLQFRWDMENVDKSSVSLTDVKAGELAYRDQYFNEHVAMLPTGTWMIAEIKDSEKWPHDFQTVFVPLPNWKDSPKGRTFSDTKMLSIPKNAQYPEQAYEFIRFYTTEGAVIRAGGFPAIVGADTKAVIDTLVGDNPDALYDMASLYAVFSNPNIVQNAPIMTPSYNQEMTDMFIAECEVYLMGGESLDDCIANIMSNGEAIMKK